MTQDEVETRVTFAEIAEILDGECLAGKEK